MSDLRSFLLACRQFESLAHAVVLPLLFALAGCGGTNATPAHVSDRHDDHDRHNHHVPPHRPGAFLDAVVQVRQRDAKLRIASTPASRRQLADIWRWMPELAAETDLPEATWNSVQTASLEAAAQYHHAVENSTSLPAVESVAGWLATLDAAVEECRRLSPPLPLEPEPSTASAEAESSATAGMMP